MQKNRLLISGGLGFIFSYVTEYFVAKGWDVYVIDNLSTGSHREIIDGSFTFINADVSDSGIVGKILDIQPDYVIHAAACSCVDTSVNFPYYSFKNNAVATMWIFEACRQLPNLKKLIYIATDECYGECEYRKNERDILFPRNPYALSKAIGSLMRITYDSNFKELTNKTCETRFCNIFGPRQDDRKIIPAIKRALDTGEPLDLHNGGTGYREWLYVKEIPLVMDLLLEKGNRVFNVTANNGYTVRELVDLAQHITGKKIKITNGERKGMDLQYKMDAARIRELGWKSQYNFTKAFKAYVENQAL